jgi:hypothetical protein
MFKIAPIESPLAERRIIFSMVKKQMIGRRAYTDSFCRKTTQVYKNASSSSSSSSSASSSPKPPTTPTAGELLEMAFSVSAC